MMKPKALLSQHSSTLMLLKVICPFNILFVRKACYYKKNLISKINYPFTEKCQVDELPGAALKRLRNKGRGKGCKSVFKTKQDRCGRDVHSALDDNLDREEQVIIHTNCVKGEPLPFSLPLEDEALEADDPLLLEVGLGRMFTCDLNQMFKIEVNFHVQGIKNETFQ